MVDWVHYHTFMPHHYHTHRYLLSSDCSSRLCHISVVTESLDCPAALEIDLALLDLQIAKDMPIHLLVILNLFFVEVQH